MTIACNMITRLEDLNVVAGLGKFSSNDRTREARADDGNAVWHEVILRASPFGLVQCR